MNNKVLSAIIVVLLVSALIVIGCQTTTSAPTTPSPEKPTPTAPSTTQTFKFKYATSEVETQAYAQKFIIPYANKIEELSEGRIKLDLYFSDSLGPASEYLSMITAGTADMAWVSPRSYGRYCAMAGYTGAISGINIRTKTKDGKYLIDVIGEKYLEPYELKDMKVLYWSQYGGDNLILREKQVKNLEDAKGLIIAYMGGGSAPLKLSSLGMTAEAIAPLDLYSAMQKGTVDGIKSGPNIIESFSMAPLVKHVTMNANIGSTLLFGAMNWDSWNKLSPDLQEAMNKANAWGKEALYDITLQKDEMGLKAAEDAGATIYYLPDEERERWLLSMKDVADEWATQMDDKGLPGTELIKEVRQIME